MIELEYIILGFVVVCVVLIGWAGIVEYIMRKWK
jgi:hypothetical protein